MQQKRLKLKEIGGRRCDLQYNLEIMQDMWLGSWADLAGVTVALALD